MCKDVPGFNSVLTCSKWKRKETVGLWPALSWTTYLVLLPWYAHWGFGNVPGYFSARNIMPQDWWSIPGMFAWTANIYSGTADCGSTHETGNHCLGFELTVMTWLLGVYWASQPTHKLSFKSNKLAHLTYSYVLTDQWFNLDLTLIWVVTKRQAIPNVILF